MTSEEYGQYIDDFEMGIDVGPDETLTQYIERRRREFESKADGGSIGIEVLFGPKVPAAPSQLVEESEIVLGYRGDDAARSDRASGRKSGRADPRGGVDRSAVSEGSQYARNVAAQNNEPSFKEKVKSVVTNPAVQTIGGAVLTGGINTAFPGVLDKLNKARMISNAIKYGKDIAMEDELESITETGGIVPYANGGRVGFFMGGPALEGQALAIYNSMNVTGATDQEIADRLTSLGLYDPNASTPDPTPDPGQGGTQSGGVGDGAPASVFGRNLNPTFNRPAGSKPKLSKDAFFGLGKFFQGQEQGTLGDRRLKAYENPMLPSIFGGIGRKFSPFNPDSKNYNPNMATQLNFLEMGTIGDKTGLNLVGYDPGSGLMKYGSDSVLAGKNVISGFGTNDYEQALMDYITKMDANTRISDAGRIARLNKAKAELAALTGQNVADINTDAITTQMKIAKTNKISAAEAAGIMAAIDRDNRATESRGKADLGSSYDEGTYCFDPNTLVQMADGSEKKIKEIQLGDQTKGGEVTGVFQFKATDEIHDYKGVTVAGSHYVKEDGKFIMVKDSPLSVKIDKIPVVYSLDTTGRRIFINDIEFADYNGDGVAKNFLTNAGVDLTGFDTEVLRQVEHRLI